ncbi:DUF3795 domain-containing protein [Chloroflexota bacterium]
MTEKKNIQSVSPCGYCCTSCAAYVNSTCTDKVAIEKEAKRANIGGYKLDLNSKSSKGWCGGCRQKQGRPHFNSLCQTYDCCVNKKGLDFCYECDDFPCLKLAPVSDFAELRRHNTKIYNLLMLKKLGLEEYIQKSGQLQTQWARGKTIPPGSDVQVQMDDQS